MWNKFIINYSRRYIQRGSAAPLFHAMGLILGTGVLIEARAHNLRDAAGQLEHH